MSIQHYVDIERSVLFEKWSGQITAEDVAAQWIWYANSEDAQACRRCFADIRAAELLFSGPELRAMVQQHLAGVEAEKETKNAILIAESEPIQMGVSRQFMAFAGSVDKDAIFTDEVEALAWLGLSAAELPWSESTP